jgi:hypothetical protein
MATKKTGQSRPRGEKSFVWSMYPVGYHKAAMALAEVVLTECEKKRRQAKNSKVETLDFLKETVREVVNDPSLGHLWGSLGKFWDEGGSNRPLIRQMIYVAAKQRYEKMFKLTDEEAEILQQLRDERDRKHHDERFGIQMRHGQAASDHDDLPLFKPR